MNRVEPSGRIEIQLDECLKDLVELKSDMKEMQATLSSKVSYKQFWSLVGILVTIEIAVFGYISNQLSVLNTQILDVSKMTTSVQGDVSYLKGKLSPFEVQFTK